ncbi:MAG: hypothetical protein FJ267_17030 [Planctomycetes bacterium]|nr:hypothetical protein [Planctomycetota bacterium]
MVIERTNVQLSKITIWLSLFGFIAALGCGGPRPVRPGTRGTIRTGDKGLADVRISVYRQSNNVAEFVGYGVSNPGGHFGLFKENAAGPLWLEPGEYSITLESEGPDPFGWATEYQDAQKTPLKQSWGQGDKSMNLNVPEPKPLPASMLRQRR